MDIHKLSSLSKMRLEEDRIEDYKKNLEFLAHKLESGVSDIECIDIVPLEIDKMCLRKDEIKPSIKRDILLSSAIAVESGCVVVPKLLEQ